jgi:hypothetical protein
MNSLDAWLTSFELRISAIEAQVRSCTLELAEPDRRVAVMDRMSALGTMALVPLRDLMADPQAEPGARVAAALVALNLGERDVAPTVLMDHIRTSGENGEFVPMAARELAANGIARSADPILEALNARDMSQATVLSFLDALRVLGVGLPRHTRDRLVAAGSFEVAHAIEEWFGQRP